MVLAGLLAALAVLLEASHTQPWQVYALDLTACLAAACAFRWPRVGGITLALTLALYLVIPKEWATMGEYAPLIPILTSGMAGRRRWRTAMSGVYFILVAVLAVQDSSTVSEAVLSWFFWAAFIAFLWLVGDSFHASALASESARTADLVVQRERLTLALHDTVARSLTLTLMDAELSRVRGDAPEDVADRLAAGTTRALQDVRLIMTILGESHDADIDLSAAAETPFGEALRTGVRELRERGMTVTTAIDGELDSLTDSESGALGPATGEAIHNMIKHGDPSQPGAVVVEITPDAVKATFVNGLRHKADEPADHRSHGLWGMAQRLRLIGGDVTTEQNATQWITTIRVPREALVPGAPASGTAR